MIGDSFLESEEYAPDVFVKNKRKEYRIEDKENVERGNLEKKGKKKKIDRLMEMLEKSHMISDRTITESAMKEDENDSRLKDSEVIKANKLLRIEVREKELKISQLQ